MDAELISDFKENACYRMDESTRMIEIAFSKVSEQHIWKRPNGVSNSIGNLILHLCGNITQYAISSLGRLSDTRERDSEFEVQNGLTKNELLQKLKSTVAKAKKTIEITSVEEWTRQRDVQGFHLSGIGIVMHVVEHYSYHTGQIAFWVKQLTETDLGYYDGIDLNIPNT